MKNSVLTLVLALAAGIATAQTTKPAAATAKPAPASKTAVAKKAVPAKAKAKPVEAAAPVAEDEVDVGADGLAIAERVHVGLLPCELGNTVQLTPDAKRQGYFDLQMQKTKYRLIPVPTTTGAIRLEDPKSGVVWLQLANKSMLMNHKLGQRMADECKSPQQIVVTEQFKIQPPPSVLDAVPAPPLPKAEPGAGTPVASDRAVAVSPRQMP